MKAPTFSMFGLPDIVPDVIPEEREPSGPPQEPDAGNKFQDTLQKALPELYGMMMIDKAGNLQSYFVSDKCAEECNLSSLKQVAKLVSIRFGIQGFDKLAGGLDLTINVFNKHFMLVRPIFQDRILVIMVPLTLNLENIKNIALNIDKPASILGYEIIKVTNEPSDFQKAQERLQPRKYIQVASPIMTESQHFIAYSKTRR